MPKGYNKNIMFSRHTGVACVILFLLTVLLLIPTKKERGVHFIVQAQHPQVLALAKSQKETLRIAPAADIAQQLKNLALPSADVVVSYAPKGKSGGSFAYTQGRGVCLVNIRLDEELQGSMVRSMIRTTHTQLSAPVRVRFNVFELLHELGHCSQKDEGYSMQVAHLSGGSALQAVPALIKAMQSTKNERNQVLPSLSVLHHELFAEAFAVYHYKRLYPDTYAKDLEAIKQWRAYNTTSTQRRGALLQASHATEAIFDMDVDDVTASLGAVDFSRYMASNVLAALMKASKDSDEAVERLLNYAELPLAEKIAAREEFGIIQANAPDILWPIGSLAIFRQSIQQL